MKLVSRPHADYVRPADDPTRADRVWQGVLTRERQRQRRRVQGRRAVLALAAALVLVVAVVRSRLAPRSDLAGLVVDSGDQHQAIILPDTSTLEVSAGARLRVVTTSPQETRIRLERGSVVCDVAPRPQRRFVVEASEVEVEVRGTRFEVSLSDDTSRPSVRVERGAVEVRTPGASPHHLMPGQSWREAPSLPASAPSAAPAVSAPFEPSASASSAPAPSARASVPSAASLWERATTARLAGRDAEAATELERLVRLYPNDPRAGLASFQLGRLRAASQPRAALDAYSHALDHAPDEAFREDAAAGRIDAAQRLGDMTSCRRWQAEFLQRYPTSAQVARVKGLCKP